MSEQEFDFTQNELLEIELLVHYFKQHMRRILIENPNLEIDNTYEMLLKTDAQICDLFKQYMKHMDKNARKDYMEELRTKLDEIIQSYNDEENIVETQNLFFHRLRYFVEYAIIFSTTGVSIMHYDDIIKNSHVIQLWVYILVIAVHNFLCNLRDLYFEYKIVFNLKQKRAPVTHFAPPTKWQNESIILLGCTSIWGLVTLCMFSRELFYSFLGISVIAIINMTIIFSPVIAIGLCCPCITGFLYNYTFKKYKTTKKRHKMIISNDTGETTEKKCAICYGNKPNIQIIPCKHNQFCSECIKYVDECPICRAKINSVKILPGTVQLCKDEDEDEDENCVNIAQNINDINTLNNNFVENMVYTLEDLKWDKFMKYYNQ